MSETVRDLGGGLVLRSVRGEPDVSRLVDMYTREQNPVEGWTAASLLAGGRVRPEEYLLVEETVSGRIASTTCLIPWRLRFCGVPLSGAQVEMVYTSPRWRHRGLVRRQFERLHELAGERGYDVFLIWGIPYYYRQFGYSYAVENSTSETLDVAAVPAGPADEVRLRPASNPDIPALRGFHDTLASCLDISIDRGEDQWRYMIQSARQPVLVVERDGTPVGYLVGSRLGNTMRALENWVPDRGTALAVLRALGRGCDRIAARWPRQSPLIQLLRELGSASKPTAQWLFRIPDLAALVAKLGPELDRRLAGGGFGTADGRFLLNLYTEAVAIEIRGGRVASVDASGPVDTSVGGSGADLSIPPDAFVRLLFGQAGVNELYRCWPDTALREEVRPLAEALFPRLEAYLSTPYHAYGPGFDALDDSVRMLYL